MRVNPTIANAGYPPRAYSYFVVAMLMVAYTFAFVDRLALSLVVDPVRADLSLNDTQISLLAGMAFVISFIVFSFPFGRWVDRGSRRGVASIGVGLWSLAMMVCGLATNFWQLFVGRMLVGAGEASINPAAYSIIPDSFPPHKRGLAMAIYSSGVAIGGGLAVYLGSLLLAWAEATQPIFPIVGALQPWQVLFIALGLPGLLFAVIFYLTVREPVRRDSGAGEEVMSKDVVAYLREHKRLYVMMFLGFAGFAISNYSFSVWGPTYFIRAHGMSVAEVGMIVGLGFAVFGTLGMLAGGLWSDRVVKAGRLEGPIWVGLRIAVIQAPFFLGAYLSPWKVPAIILFCCGMFSASMIGGLQGAMVQTLTPNRMRGQIGAVFLTTVNLLGLGVAPLLTGVMTDYVFGDPADIGKSLAVTTMVSLVVAFVLISLSMNAARERAKAVLEL